MNNDSLYWNSVAKKITKHHLEKNIAEYKKNKNINLIEKWVDLKNKTILKTDLFEEMLITDSFYPWLKTQTKKIVGIDISSEIVRKAKQKNSDANFKVEDVRSTSFKDNTFDTIISNSTLDHFPKKDLIISLKELKRILKPKGTIILTLDNKENKKYYYFYLINKYLNPKHFKQERCYSLKEIKEIVNITGFKIIDYKGIIHIPTPFNKFSVILKKIFGNKTDNYIKRKIKKYDSKQNKLKTAWQVAVKIRKE